jgi:hypothetical protein
MATTVSNHIWHSAERFCLPVSVQCSFTIASSALSDGQMVSDTLCKYVFPSNLFRSTMAFAIPQLRAIERRISFSFTIPIGERGKVKRGESLVKALKREVYEETGLRVQIDSLLGVLDRRDKDAITLLFAALPDKQSMKLRRPDKEIQRAVFQPALPKRASPSAKYFWSARRGAVKKPPKIRASTHQFPSTPAFAQSSS